MRYVILTLAVLFFFAASADAQRSSLKSREREFMKLPPQVGQPLPRVDVLDIHGKPFSTGDLRGSYTVLTFGCLTCPPSIWNIRGLEAVQRDYVGKDVKFYFIFKSLAHPELVGDYVQPFTDEERVLQARQAVKQFGTTIPWLVDKVDNRLKHALGDRPNSQFLIDPTGKIVRKRAWANYHSVRSDLEELVGKSPTTTRPEDIQLVVTSALKSPAPRGLVDRIERLEMRPIISIPSAEESKFPFYAKLRAEADRDLLARGRGKLYLGFHLDPIHGAYWNNLSDPLRVRLSGTDSVTLEASNLVAKKMTQMTDADPREFVLAVESWKADSPLRVEVTYFACEGGTTCKRVNQSYTLHLRRDVDGGGARSEGSGLWKANEMTARLLAGDNDGDGQINRAEAAGLILPHFEDLDRDNSGRLDRKELAVFTEWINHHHQSSGPKE